MIVAPARRKSFLLRSSTTRATAVRQILRPARRARIPVIARTVVDLVEAAMVEEEVLGIAAQPKIPADKALCAKTVAACVPALGVSE